VLALQVGLGLSSSDPESYRLARVRDALKVGTQVLHEDLVLLLELCAWLGGGEDLSRALASQAAVAGTDAARGCGHALGAGACRLGGLFLAGGGRGLVPLEKPCKHAVACGRGLLAASQFRLCV